MLVRGSASCRQRTVLVFYLVTAVDSAWSADSDLETMERLQIGVGPRPKSPLLLRDQNKKAPLWDYLMI